MGWGMARGGVASGWRGWWLGEEWGGEGFGVGGGEGAGMWRRARVVEENKVCFICRSVQFSIAVC